MATLSTRPAEERSATKPSRSMTYPLRDATRTGHGKPRQKPKNGEPFDANELSRKLNAHLTEQKIKAEKRRADRAAKEAIEQNHGVYRHVPMVAAAAFERTTTTVDSTDGAHMLSKAAIKSQMDLLRKDEPLVIKTVTVKPLQHSNSTKRVKAIEKARSSRDLITNGGRVQLFSELEELAEQDTDRERYNPRRNFNDELRHLQGKHVRNAHSTGEMFWEDSECNMKSVSKPEEEILPHTALDRPDWLQRDDCVVSIKKKNRSSPILKKMESSWLLISKKREKHDDEAVAGLESPEEKGTTTIITKPSFLARFRRQTGSH